MCDGSSLVVGSVYVPDVNRELYWKSGYFESFKQLWGDEVVCCSRVYKDFSFSRHMCRLKEYCYSHKSILATVHVNF